MVILVENRKIFPPWCILCPLELGSAQSQKSRMMGLSGGHKVLR